MGSGLHDTHADSRKVKLCVSMSAFDRHVAV